MPLVECTLTAGRTPEQIRGLVTSLTNAVVDAVAAPKESVRVIVREIPAEHFAAGDVTIAERRAAQASAAGDAAPQTTPKGD